MALLGLGGSAMPEAPQAAAATDTIKDGTLESFQRDVIEASMAGPVLVDFWAPWCGPCKQLTPMLEKQIKATQGKARLVKINIDDNPELAQQMQVQSVPMVFVFLRGQPVTGFQGVQPESQIKTLLEKLTGGPLAGDPSELGIDAAKEALEAGDIDTAAAAFSAVMEQEPENVEAIAGLARCLIAHGAFDQAEEILGRAPKEQEGHAAITGAKASLSIAREAGAIGDPATLTAAVERDGDDHQARYELAMALFLRGDIEASVEHLCTIVRKDRAWNDDGARKQLVKLFAALGPGHAAAAKGRRMLSRVLFS